MKATLFFLFLTMQTIQTFSQTYFNEDFEQVDKAVASYYEYRDSTLSGITKRIYYSNDTLYTIKHYSGLDNKYKYGKCLEYYKSGQLKYAMNYINNKLHGELKGYYENGNVKREEHYADGTLLDSKCFGYLGQDTTYYIYEKDACFKHGDLTKFRNFVASELVYPQICYEQRIEGRVFLQFYVNTSGKVEDIKILSSPNSFFSESAKNAISKSPKWEPAIQEGKIVKQMFTMPIIYKLR